jgi:hypothetical protein
MIVASFTRLIFNGIPLQQNLFVVILIGDSWNRAKSKDRVEETVWNDGYTSTWNI